MNASASGRPEIFSLGVGSNQVFYLFFFQRQALTQSFRCIGVSLGRLLCLLILLRDLSLYVFVSVLECLFSLSLTLIHH